MFATAIPLCHPTEVALKSYFLGPRSENAEWMMERVQEILRRWFHWRRESFPDDGRAISLADQHDFEFRQRQQAVVNLLDDLTRRLEKELPKFSPRYVGHMFSEISLPALLGHMVTLLHNPNIVSRESATVAADIENEAIDSLAKMLGLPRSLGHFTSGGTVANFEAVVRANARIQAWMALGVKRSGLTMFEAAHMGWEPYQEHLPAMCAEELTPYIPERSNPWEAVRLLESAYAVRYRGPALIVPQAAHYSWKKAARIFGIGEANLRYVQSAPDGRYCIADLKKHLAHCQRLQQPVLAVVSVVGTTETGSVDPVHEIQDLLDELKKRDGLHIWHHVDAAYGGFFCSLLSTDSGEPLEPLLSAPVYEALSAVGRTDSVTVDPHKLGYVPYSSGAFMIAHPADYTCVQTLAPYIDYRNADDRGPYTLEGSRSAAGAVATWLTARSIGLGRRGYGLLIARTIRQKQKLQNRLVELVPTARVYPGCDTNLLCFCLAARAESLHRSNQRVLRVLQRLADEGLYFLSKTHFPVTASGTTRDFVSGWGAVVDTHELVALRLTLMNPFFDSAELDVAHIDHLVRALSEVDPIP